MKKIINIVTIIFIFLVVFALDVVAEDDHINIEYADEGYFIVNYEYPSSPRMKVGVTINKQTTYYDYTCGEYTTYAFQQGEGSYKITLYRNICGTSYVKVTSKKVEVDLINPMSPYLVSTSEVSYSIGDNVYNIAQDVCYSIEDDYLKVVAIHNFVNSSIKYDYEFADKVLNGIIKQYKPTATNVLKSGKGICYDYAVLFAAMCRSQNIPCYIQKGYVRNTYHAWNKVYVDGLWIDIDATIPLNN